MDLTTLARYRFAGRSEQAVREEWIRPLLTHLGYGIETLNQVVYEQSLTLASPLRRLGSRRVRVDYKPTVLGHGLWIIEAKAHNARDAWDDAISQAWLYATHPEIDVPLMVIADGSRIAVYDVYQPNWDEPVIDLATVELEEGFVDLARVLSAAQVTTAVRRRRMRHLGLAMRSELSFARLNAYVRDVEELVREAKPAVAENQRSILQDEAARQTELRDAALAEHGLFAAGVGLNQPLARNLQLARAGVTHVSSLPEERRPAELKRLVAAAENRSASGTRQARMFWMLRIGALFIYLHLRDDPGCGEQATELAREAVRDHILNFPDAPLARAAHRLERVLPTFALRLALDPEHPDLHGVARAIQAHWSDETRLRANLDADALLIDFVERATRRLWNSLPWTEEALNQVAGELEARLGELNFRTDGASGPAGDPFLEWHYTTDQLLMATLYELGDLITVDLLDDQIVARLAEIAADDTGDELRLRRPARRLLERAGAAGR
jgi:hypothetical protein